MSSVPKTVSITDLRMQTKDIIKQASESDEPIYIIYNSQIPVCLVSTQYLENAKTKMTQSKTDLKKYAGFLKNSKAYKTDPVKYQKKIRTEWDAD